jgi:hypothetical protein
MKMKIIQIEQTDLGLTALDDTGSVWVWNANINNWTLLYEEKSNI